MVEDGSLQADEVGPGVETELGGATSPVAEHIERVRLASGSIERQHQLRAESLRGASFVGSPEDLVEKILFQHELFGHQRFLLQLSVGTIPHDRLMRSIELFGTEVAPAVRAELARRAVPAAAESYS